MPRLWLDEAELGPMKFRSASRLIETFRNEVGYNYGQYSSRDDSLQD